MNYKKKYEKYKKKYLIAKLSGGDNSDNDYNNNPMTTSDYAEGLLDGSQGDYTTKWTMGALYPNYMLGYNDGQAQKAKRDARNSMFKSGKVSHDMF
tara:strand:+ start:316 stop:603 length:288 start_codon:yes stop_codon:yes gene_type:complete